VLEIALPFRLARRIDAAARARVWAAGGSRAVETRYALSKEPGGSSRRSRDVLEEQFPETAAALELRSGRRASSPGVSCGAGRAARPPGPASANGSWPCGAATPVTVLRRPWPGWPHPLRRGAGAGCRSQARSRWDRLDGAVGVSSSSTAVALGRLADWSAGSPRVFASAVAGSLLASVTSLGFTAFWVEAPRRHAGRKDRMRASSSGRQFPPVSADEGHQVTHVARRR